MDKQTNEWMENLPILQDFAPYWCRCPASPMKTKEKVEQGKGTADHLMHLGYLFFHVYKPIETPPPLPPPPPPQPAISYLKFSILAKIILSVHKYAHFKCC